MSGGNFQLESEGFVCVKLIFNDPENGIMSDFDEDFCPITSVGQLKEEMYKKLNVPPEEQVWTYNGKELKDDQTLDDVEVEPDDIIEITRKPAGG